MILSGLGLVILLEYHIQGLSKVVYPFKLITVECNFFFFQTWYHFFKESCLLGGYLMYFNININNCCLFGEHERVLSCHTLSMRLVVRICLDSVTATF